jgi:hypothetical protein
MKAPRLPSGLLLAFPLAWATALAAILFVRADERPSLNALDAFAATRALVTLPLPPRVMSSPPLKYARANRGSVAARFRGHERTLDCENRKTGVRCCSGDDSRRDRGARQDRH